MAVLLMTVGCSLRGSSPSPDGGLVVVEDLELPWRRLLRLPEEPPPPASMADLRVAWATATTAFSIGAYSDATRAFRDVADGLTAAEQGPYASALRAARCTAYENIAASLVGLAPDARPDSPFGAPAPGCRHTLERARARVEAETSTHAAGRSGP